MSRCPIACLVILIASRAPVHADLVLTFGTGPDEFTMEFVTIGNPGNVADTTGTPNPAGAVPYTFGMGKYEVSRDMVTKANASSAVDGTGSSLGITLTNLFTGPNQPATGVTWNEAARFVNWLNTSSGFQPAYKFSTQPGDVDYDSNENIQLWEDGEAGFNAANPFRNSQAQFVLSSWDEWYKAAYHDATAGTAGTYFSYPTGSDTVPDGIDVVGDTVFDAVFNDGAQNSHPNDVTDVGIASPYGTFGQGGNVWEWHESEDEPVHRPTNDLSSFLRGFRGGRWRSPHTHLLKSNRSSDDPPDEDFDVGFRVARVPEPGAFFFISAVTAVTLTVKLPRRGKRTLKKVGRS